jgi:hypothetical protein
MESHFKKTRSLERETLCFKNEAVCGKYKEGNFILHSASHAKNMKNRNSSFGNSK